MTTDFAEYDDCDALELARLVRGGDITPGELMEAAIARAQARNPALNAINLPLFERGRREAAGAPPPGPFSGVPFLLKDILHALAGVPMSHGSRALIDFVPVRDSELVGRFKRSGLVIFGKTNTPEFALMGVTEPEAFGPTRNPWDTRHTPGGSSGGSAAAVAARIVPMASASDGGGSIRIPAACCGLFGLKPTRGRTPVGPDHAEVWDGASCDHVLTRSVRDSAAALDVLRGPDEGASAALRPPDTPYLEAIERPPGRLRIGFSTRSPLGAEVDPEAIRAVEDAAALLRGLGHEVEEATPRIDGHAVARCYLMIYFGHVAADLAWLRSLGGKAKARSVEDATYALGLIGRSLPAGDYVASRRRWNEFARAMGAFHRRFDLYLTPSIATPPVRVGELQPGAAERLATRAVNRLGLGRLLIASGIVDKLAEANLARTPFTQLANLTGQPAMSVPLYRTPAGLPLGVQFIAPFGDEATLLRLAAQLEQARPWARRKPPMVAG